MASDETAEKATPAGGVAMDLDALEREGGSPEPFTIRHLGRRYLLSDPREVDWQKLMVALGNPVLLLRTMLPPDDVDEFFNSELPTWKLDAMLTAYIAHYGLPTGPEGSGSATS